ncbi:CaiB/BaiF CoA-transferase family protein [Conexibacter sp. CPCC 206217]|uniref:CaiB/BaiF CoA transferase family protein n=1 Tax=Conexibacter sp. CPCC 206217 TaxID=3064574 RepID=UPI00272302E5|nr:CoA transferase [Conexibacter sp. CPCC 206217]MDO8212217.1 CoA transferase [Conexibacter sp. CPCC 206217]
MTGPLQGVRVIDLTHALAGPYGTMLLADLGADVVKVEPPQGDLARGLGPYRDDDEQHAYGGLFQSVNRGKRSIVLDLKTAEGIDTLLALVSEAEVLVESFSVGVMERLGVAYERLRGINPRLVYASTRGFGDPRTGESPYAAWPVDDVVLQAIAGPLGIAAASASAAGDDAGEPPAETGLRIADIFPGTLTALGVVSAVLHARKTGQGQYVDVAMYDGVLSLCERLVYEHSYGAAAGGGARDGDGNGGARGGDGDGEADATDGAPIDVSDDGELGVLPAKDGWIALAAPTRDSWRRLCELIERPDLVDDERFATKRRRRGRRDQVRAQLSEWTRPRTRREILQRLGGEVPAAPVNSAADIFADEHPRRRGMLLSVPHPGCPEPVVIAGQPIKFTATPSELGRRAPLLDEHGDEIRCELAPDQGAQLDARVTGLETI